MLLKARGFTALAVAILALGIGANTAVFSILDGTLLRPLPYRDPQRLVDVLDESGREARLRKLFASYADYREYRKHSTLLEDIAAVTWAAPKPILYGRGPSRTVVAIPASENFFRLLGVTPELGRGFTAADAAGGCTVLLAHTFWKESLSADPRIVGQSLDLDGHACSVAGVMPASFSFYPPATQLWQVMTPELTDGDHAPPVFIVGRLRPGVTRAQVRAELEPLHAAIQTTGLEREFGPAVDDLQDEFTWVAGRNLRTTMWVLAGAVGLVLLIACLNVANLLLGRSLVRRREFAVRSALGAGRARLIRQLLTEGMVLAGSGGVLGVGVAYAALRYFRAVNPVELPVGSEVGLSLPALLFTAAASMATALVFGLAPAWKSARLDLTEALKSGGRSVSGGGNRAARVLVAAQVALSVALLAGAGLLIESVDHMATENLGFHTERLYTAPILLPRDRYKEEATRGRFYDQFEAKLAAQPGLARVALGKAAPPFTVRNFPIQIEGRPFHPDHAVHDVGHEAISLGYFRTLGMTLLRGRDFGPGDRADTEQVTVVDAALAHEYFPGTNPIGQRIRVIGQNQSFPWVKIVGVVAAVKRSTVYREMGWVESPTMYRPMAQHIPDSATIVLVAAGDAAPIAAALRRATAEIDPEAALGEIEAVNHSLRRIMSYPRFRAVVFGAFAAFALLLATAGLFGVLSQTVAQRRQEIGVRMAIGAQPIDIIRMVMVQAGMPVAAGLLAGLAASLLMGRWGATLLYGVTAGDPLTLGAVSVVLALSAAAASALPARRAAHTNPTETLRAE